MDFSVDTEIARRSVTIKDMLDNLGIEEVRIEKQSIHRIESPLNFWNNKKVRFHQTHIQGLSQLFFTVSWDLCA